MHTRTAVAAITAAALLLAGCTSAATDVESKASPTVSKEDRFLTAVKDADFQSWNEKRPSEAELLEFPEQWCDALRDGHSVEWMFDGKDDSLYPIGWNWGTREDDAQQLLILAVTVYCPSYRARVTDELRSSGVY
ncbi:DUF732 domain-containing protein [Streptomyces lydicus]|uniref:DUF732 domain-containing protein n=1 Tax=Streptomyces lydicus TaxID=47763 RepID=UPI00342C0474